MVKVNKSKVIMSITIGLMSFVMIYVMLIQFNIVKENNNNKDVELMRETELKEMLANYKEKYEETEKEIIDVQAKIEEYKQDEKSEEDAVRLLEEEVKKSNMLLGNTDVTGEGIIIRMENNINDRQESKIIMAADLISLVNELKIAGAEAISINGERIVSKSDIFDIGNFVCINGQRTTSPYEIRAIGDKKYLQSALSIKGGYIDTYTLGGYTINMEVKDQGIFIGKYQGEMTLKYVKK